jgi:NAD(P)H-hydrate epimerase
VYSAADDKSFERMKSLLTNISVVLDGVLGTGVRLPLRVETAEFLDIARQTLAGKSEIHVVAVDCPSGVDCDSGEAAPQCIPAEITVSMAAAKQGLLKFPAANYVGELRFVGIGLGESGPPPKAWQRISRFLTDDDYVRTVLPKRPLDAHKGTFGTALVVAGSINYSGAALLAGKAAYRAGAGLVTMAVPHPLHNALAGHFPEAIWLLLPEEDGGIAENAADVVLDNMQNASALLIGPGAGLAEGTRRFWPRLLSMEGRSSSARMGFTNQQKNSSGERKPSLPPMVVDADGLKLLAKLKDWPSRLPGPAVLTPHPGEMAILTNLSKDEIQANRVETAERFAKEWGHVVVLKGAFTVVASPGGETAVVPVATPALARAGTGDVLAGLIAGLRAQGVPAFEAAAAGAWIHANAGLRAAEKLGSTAAALAGDVLAAIPEILAKL